MLFPIPKMPPPAAAAARRLSQMKPPMSRMAGPKVKSRVTSGEGVWSGDSALMVTLCCTSRASRPVPTKLGSSVVKSTELSVADGACTGLRATPWMVGPVLVMLLTLSAVTWLRKVGL